MTLILQDVGASETGRNAAHWKNPWRHLAERLRSVENQVDQAESKRSDRVLQTPPDLTVFHVIATVTSLPFGRYDYLQC